MDDDRLQGALRAIGGRMADAEIDLVHDHIAQLEKERDTAVAALELIAEVAFRARYPQDSGIEV